MSVTFGLHRVTALRIALFLVATVSFIASAADFKIQSFRTNGLVTWTNGFSNGVCSVEAKTDLNQLWIPGPAVFTSNRTGQIRFVVPKNTCFYRLRLVDVSGTPQGFTNLTESYGILETLAGKGGYEADYASYWSEDFEGGNATDANLSRPHIAMADLLGNIYIADKNSHSVLKLTTNGTIHTVAGTHEQGFNGDGPTNATLLRLDSPNGLWVRKDGTVFILDTDNGKVRKLATNGVMTTVFTSNTTNISGGRGLWVRDDEQLIYYSAGEKLKKWTPASGTKNINTNFVELGNIAVDAAGQIIATDRGASYVYKVDPSSGVRTVIAGNGTWFGGGDGYAATNTGLAGVRGVWIMPNRGLLLATHEGSQIWYLDTAGIIHLFVDGARWWHDGDGQWFHSTGYKVSEPRAVTMDYEGNILITESDYGFVRRIRFVRMPPD